MKVMTFNFFISHPKKKEKSPYTAAFEKTTYVYINVGVSMFDLTHEHDTNSTRVFSS